MSKHRIVVVGAGSIGERHIRCFLATGRADVEFVETKAALAAEISERYGVKRHTDLDAALGTQPSAAVIATPAPLHVAQATRFAEAGVSILIEKPLSVSLDGVERLRTAATERNVTVGVAYVYRAYPMFASLRDAI